MIKIKISLFQKKFVMIKDMQRNVGQTKTGFEYITFLQIIFICNLFIGCS